MRDAAVADHTSYKCPQCGAAQALQPGLDALGCDHCGHQVPIDTPNRPIHEHDFDEARRRVRRGPATDLVAGGHEVQCKHCGARSVTARHAQRCAFCDEPLVVEVVAAPDTVLPDAVLPFAVTKDAAGAAFKSWMASRWFAPSDLRRRARKDGLDGVYVPYWTYDSDTTTRYTGARGEHYYVDEEYTDSQGKRQTRRVQKTRWYSAAGTVFVAFDDVLISASKGMPRQRLAQLEPWHLDELRPFDGAYLAGFVAERYSLDLEEGFREASAIMERRIEGAVRRDIGGDEQRIHSMDVRHADVRFKHVLLPVWVSSFKYDDKVFRVVVNARTGEVAGDRPWSVVKIVLFVLAIAALIAAIVLLVQHFREPAPPEDPGPSVHQVRASAAMPFMTQGCQSGMPG
ncbi:MAG TPA: hypothetical protein VM734_01755 [Kofleriaceae bacterium]|nr:hypothetical protein [Kofleriaceae bacterium]